MIESFFLYAIIGKLIIYIVQQFPLHKVPILGALFQPEKFLWKWWTCDLCLGFWVYFLLAFPAEINLPQEWLYVPGVTEVIQGMATSFIVHIFSLGWNDKFSTYILE